MTFQYCITDVGYIRSLTNLLCPHNKGFTATLTKGDTVRNGGKGEVDKDSAGVLNVSSGIGNRWLSDLQSKRR